MRIRRQLRSARTSTLSPEERLLALGAAEKAPELQHGGRQQKPAAAAETSDVTPTSRAGAQ